MLHFTKRMLAPLDVLHHPSIYIYYAYMLRRDSPCDCYSPK